jgi:N-acyl-D-amino-acid deacylase
MLSHSERSLLADGRALSDVAQGVTLEVLGESSMGPLTADMKRRMLDRQGDIKFAVTWSTLGEFLDLLERKGIAPNVASFVGASTIREAVVGESDLQPDRDQLALMATLVRQAMEDGALGLTTALIYAPATYAKTSELVALAKVSAQCGGIYASHIRNEGDRIEEAIRETIDVAQSSGVRRRKFIT